MNKENKQGVVIANFIWRFLERFGAQIVTFVVSVILARILDPELYGTIALVTVFITIMQVFVDSGLGNALIQKKNADDLDFSTVFYTNVVICLALYWIMFAIAPLIAAFYEIPVLTSVIRVLSLIVVISGVKNVQQAYVSRNMLFKKFFFSTLGGTIVSAVIGIVMALNGFGLWALVAQNLSNLLIDTLILWITVKWRPKAVFSWKRLKGLFSFGWKMLAAGLLDTVYNNVRQLIIGKRYSSEDLAYYNKGKQFPYLIALNINTSIDSVLLPTISKEQDNRDHVKSMTRRAIKVSCFLMWPLLIGLAVCAEPLVRLLLTDKWIECVPYLRIFCVSFAFYPIHTANLNAIKALGRSDIFLKLEIVKKVIGVVSIVAAMWFGVLVMAYSLLVTDLICVFVNAFPNRKLLKYNYSEQIKDILPSILLSAGMAAVVYSITFIGLADWLTLLIQVPLGVCVYVGGAKLLRFESYDYLLGALKGMLKKMKDRKNAPQEQDEESMKKLDETETEETPEENNEEEK